MESHLQTQRAAIKMLHERIVILVKYVTEVVAGKFSCGRTRSSPSEDDDRRSGDQRSCSIEVPIGADGIPSGDRELGIP